MAFDGIVTKAIVTELSELTGARINKVFEPNKNEIILGLYSEKKNYALVKVNIKTGRKNQIRAVLSYLGYPIVGDTKYTSDIKAKRLLLHASKIVLTNPNNKKKYTFESKLPREFQKYV